MTESTSLCVIICESTTQVAGLMLPLGREWRARYEIAAILLSLLCSSTVARKLVSRPFLWVVHHEVEARIISGVFIGHFRLNCLEPVIRRQETKDESSDATKR
jgi:hypothetical protein